MEKSMFKVIIALSGAIAGGAHAAAPPVPALKYPIELLLTSELTDYSQDRGSRRKLAVNVKRKTGNTTLALDGATGSLKTDDRRYQGSMANLTVAHDWSPAISTRTAVGLATNSPLFPKRSIMQEVSFKPGHNIVLATSVKASRYYGGVDVTALSVGPAWYFRGGSIAYRFSRYDVSGLGKSSAHLFNLRLSDPRGAGSTQVWMGAGDTLHDQEIFPTIEPGKFRSVAVRRIQPLVGNVALSVGVGRDWYETPSGKFTATRPTLGIVIN
jgi:YaiO family outer membrane protein